MKNHPLFPAPDGSEDKPDDRDIRWIYVHRNEKGVDQICPRKFTAEELTEPEQLYELFGGGAYMLIGRDDTKIRARSPRIMLPGASKPLVPEEAAPPKIAAPTAAAAGPSGGFDLGSLIMLQMQQQQAAQTQQTQIIVALIGAMGNKAAPGIDPALIEMIKAGSAQNAAALNAVAAMARPAAAPSTPLSELREAISLGREMATPAAGPAEDDAIDKMIEAFAGGAGMGMTAGSGNAANG